MAAGPERVIGTLDEDGILFADIDLDRVRWLRSTREELTPYKQYRCLPGTGTAEWIKPKMYIRYYEEWMKGNGSGEKTES